MIPKDIKDKIHEKAEDASCGYETAKYYLEKGYSLASPKQDEQERIEKLKSEMKMFEDLEDPSVGDLMTYFNRIKKCLTK